MELERKLKTLQMYYAAALADSTVRYGNAGILDRVTKEKRNEQVKAGATLAERFDVKEPKQAFIKTQDMYGCANWSYEDTADGFIATTTNCMLCALSKRLGIYSPCQIHCLSPIEAMVKGVSPSTDYNVEKTLWDSDKCVVRVTYNE